MKKKTQKKHIRDLRELTWDDLTPEELKEAKKFQKESTQIVKELVANLNKKAK